MDEVVFNERYKEALLDIFKRLISFLDSYHIRWFVAGGTCLGAVRHHGIIPWDDDIDIVVLRDDYERLFELRSHLEAFSLELVSIEDGIGFYNGFIKICDRNTTLWERREFEHVIGIYIDVFPLDKSDISVSDYLKARTLYRDKMQKYLDSICKTDLHDILHLLKNLHLRTCYNRIHAILSSHDTKRNYDEFLQSTRQIAFNPNGSHVMVVMGSYFEREYWPSEWFDTFVEIPFSDFTVKAPVKYDEMLRHVYGDYMKFPPKEKQVAHHFHYYCNFKERLSIAEVKERMRKGETVVF